jgi:hypothetical protein
MDALLLLQLLHAYYECCPIFIFISCFAESNLLQCCNSFPFIIPNSELVHVNVCSSESLQIEETRSVVKYEELGIPPLGHPTFTL